MISAIPFCAVHVASMIISNDDDDDEDVSDSSCASGLLLLVCPPPTQVCPAHSTDFHICSVSIRQKYTKKIKNKNTGDCYPHLLKYKIL